jgi:small-conductance mechanosensitive channel
MDETMTHSTVFVQIVLSLIALLLYLITHQLVRSVIRKLSIVKEIGEQRSLAVRKGVRLMLLTVFVVVLGFIWGYDIQALLAASAGFFALVGVAFFAVWSILSNITSSIIIFFRFPLRIGDTIMLPEAEGVSGRVVDITLFHILLEDDDGHTFAIPNNVVVQKILRINKRTTGESLQQ